MIQRGLGDRSAPLATCTGRRNHEFPWIAASEVLDDRRLNNATSEGLLIFELHIRDSNGVPQEQAWTESGVGIRHCGDHCWFELLYFCSDGLLILLSCWHVEDRTVVSGIDVIECERKILFVDELIRSADLITEHRKVIDKIN